MSEWVQDRFADTYPACRASCKNPVNDVADTADAAPDKAADKADKNGKGAKGKPAKGKPAKGKPAKAGKADAKAAAVAGVMRVVRGGNFDLPADACRGAGRSRLAQDQASFNTGFRCVRSLEQ